MEKSHRESDESIGSSERRTNIIDRTLNLVVIGLALYVVFRPGGPFLGWLQAQADGRQIRNQLEIVWPELVAGGHRLDTGSGHVVLVEFSDYQCPFCQRTHPELAEFLSKHSQAGVVYRHLPLSIHPAAEEAAKAAICADQQGRFQEMHRHLFETERWARARDWAVEAEDIGLPNIPRFIACLDEPATAAQLDRDRDMADALGIAATPTFVTRQSIIRGATDRQGLEELAGVP